MIGIARVLLVLLAGNVLVVAASGQAAPGAKEERTRLEQALKKAAGPAEAAAIHASIARVIASTGGHDEAKTYLTALAEKSPASALKLELARFLLDTDLRSAGEAAESIRGVVKTEPKNIEAWLLYGKAYAKLQNFKEALRGYEMVRRHLAPKELRALHGLVEVFILRGEMKRARDVAKEALLIGPEDPETHAWLGRTFDRDRHLAQGYSAAINSYENAYRLDHSNARYLGHILFDLVMSRSFRLATTQAARLSRHPQDSVALWFEGLEKEKAGEVAAAVALQQRAVAADSRNVYARYALANLYAGRATPGFGPILGGPRSESWRYRPHRDPAKAMQQASAIKLVDPTFPYMSFVDNLLEEQSASMYSSAEPPDEQSMQRIQKLVGYYQHLQMSR